MYDIRRQWLWVNKYIKVNIQEIRWKKWMHKGINIIHDIVNKQGNFLTIDEIEQIHNLRCDALQYNSVKDAIPNTLRDKLNKFNIHRDILPLF